LLVERAINWETIVTGGEHMIRQIDRDAAEKKKLGFARKE